MLLTVLASIFVFGMLVLFHELGHFFMAKAMGMRVDEFAIGFGPRLCSGCTGNDQVSNTRFPYKESLTWSSEKIFLGISSAGGTNQSENLIYEKRAFNPNIRWEIEDKRNIGIDVGLFDNSLVIHADYFNNLRKDILIQRNTVSDVSGLIENPHWGRETIKEYMQDTAAVYRREMEERRVGKECRSRWSPYH